MSIAEFGAEFPAESRAINECRVKTILMDPQLLIEILNWCNDPCHCLALPIADPLPEDCRVVAVRESFERRCLELLVWSRQFPPVALGALPERLPGTVTEFRKVAFPERPLFESHKL